jgi:hypothetical protein
MRPPLARQCDTNCHGGLSSCQCPPGASPTMFLRPAVGRPAADPAPCKLRGLHWLLDWGHNSAAQPERLRLVPVSLQVGLPVSNAEVGDRDSHRDCQPQAARVALRHHDGLVPSRAGRRRVKAAARGPGPGPLARPRLVLPCQVLAGFSESGARPGLPGGGVTVPPPVKTVKPEPTGPAAHHQQNAPCIIMLIMRLMNLFIMSIMDFIMIMMLALNLH